MTGIIDIKAIDLEKETKQLTSPRRPHDMVFVGDSLLRAVLCEGEGKWYIHDYDEFFLHYSGGVVVIESDESTIEAIFLVFRHRETACMLA